MQETQAPVPQRKKWPIWTAVGALSILAGGWWYSQHAQDGGLMGAKSSASAARGAGGGGPVAVGIAPVLQQDAPLLLSALGTVVPSNATVVRSQVTGQLRSIHFTEGQNVRKGQLLAVLDDRAQNAAQTQAEGQLMRDQALLANARADLARYQQLWKLDSIAKQTVDTQAALVRQYEGTVKVDQGSLAAAKVNVSYTRIVAPVAGKAGLRQVDIGNSVTPSDANGIVSITQTDPMDVVFALPEEDVARVHEAAGKQGQLAVRAMSRDGQKELAVGRLLAMDNQISTATGTFNSKARFANHNNALFPNQFVNVELNLGNMAAAILAPTAAVQIGKQGPYVYMVKADNTVTMVPVKLGPTSGMNTVITEGLEAGQNVVVDGLDKLRDGSKIQAVDRAAQTRAAAEGGGKHGKKAHGAASDAAVPASAASGA